MGRGKKQTGAQQTAPEPGGGGRWVGGAGGARLCSEAARQQCGVGPKSSGAQPPPRALGVGGTAARSPLPKQTAGRPDPQAFRSPPSSLVGGGLGVSSQSSKSPEPNRAMSCARPQLPRAKLWGLRGRGKVADVTGGEGGRGNAFGQTQPGTHKMTSRLGKHRSAALRHRGGGTERGLPRAPDPKTPIKAPTPPPPSPPPTLREDGGV